MPPSPSPVLDAERRAWNYWFVDGLPNLVSGVLCLLISGVYVLASGPPHVRSPLVITIVAVVFGYLRRGISSVATNARMAEVADNLSTYWVYNSSVFHQLGDAANRIEHAQPEQRRGNGSLQHLARPRGFTSSRMVFCRHSRSGRNLNPTD